MNYQTLKLALIKKSSAKKAKIQMSFFKTAKGEYGEGDQFIGVTTPDIRVIAMNNPNTPLNEVLKLLKSPINEERLLALFLLVQHYQKSNPQRQKQIASFYLKNRRYVNNWNLVDSSAHHIIGHFYFSNNSSKKLETLIQSKKHWDRRIAMVSTLFFIRNGNTKVAFKLAEKVLHDKEDLMHKASGWMLREAGKKDLPALKKFINTHGKSMPRTMLRYAIEKFPQQERKNILETTKKI